MTVADKLSSRDNGVTLLRLGFALLVVFGHAWEVGGYGPDPAQRAAGVTCGEIGVNAFFALSGFLVTQSWLRSRSAQGYFWRRILRIFPGFWVCLLATGFGLFPWLWARQHGVRWQDAFTQAPFLGYVAHNALLWIRQATIGDLFATQPATGMANGALWSLFPEFLCYVGVVAAGLLGCFASRRKVLLWLAAAIAFTIHAGGSMALARLSGHARDTVWYLWRLDTQATFFVVGALGCVYAGRLRVGATRMLAGLLLLALALCLHRYGWFAPLLLPFAVFQAASLIPGAWLDRIGDYSYGIYVYHYPLQQALVFLGCGTLGCASFFGLTLALVLPVAAASWHWVEKPSLRLKDAFQGAQSNPYWRHFWRVFARNPVKQIARLAEFKIRSLQPERLADERSLLAAAKAGSNVVPTPPILRPPPHEYLGYRGPWLEDSFFHHWLQNAGRTAVAYVPVFWTDLYLHVQTQRFTPRQFARFQAGIRELTEGPLAENRCYFTILEYDHPIWDWHLFPRNTAVFSAGGWGDIPIPLLKGSPPFSCPPKDIPLSFVGRLVGSSNTRGVRSLMRSQLQDHALFTSGPHWREIMGRSTFSLCPRGLGPTSFRLYEALSVGSIPIYIWDEVEWLPYRDELDWSEFSISLHVSEIARLPALLAEYPPERIARIQARIASVYDDYFTLHGTCRQIMRRVEELSDLSRFGALMAKRPYPPYTAAAREVPDFLRS
jgi:peptidoglycan/LPS O-acetylase OafA/YrhL